MKKKKSRQMPCRKRKQQRESEDAIESDETFAFIAGYTPGGAPYGVTWEEWSELDEEPKNAGWVCSPGKGVIMSAPSKACNRQPVKIRHGQSLTSRPLPNVHLGR